VGTILGVVLLQAPSARADGECPAYWDIGEIEKLVADGSAEVAVGGLVGAKDASGERESLLGGGVYGHADFYAGAFWVHVSLEALGGKRLGAPPEAMGFEKLDAIAVGDVLVGGAWQTIREVGLNRTIASTTIGDYVLTAYCAESQLKRRVLGFGVGAKSMIVASTIPDLADTWALGPEIGIYFDTAGARTMSRWGTMLLVNYAFHPLATDIPVGLGGQWRAWVSFGRFTMTGDVWRFAKAFGYGLSLGYLFGPVP
jgi:hypothetical protein